MLIVTCMNIQAEQTAKPDLQKLEVQLAKATDSQRLDLLIELSSELQTRDPRRSHELALEALTQLTDEADYTKRKRVLLVLGVTQDFTGDFEAALASFKKVEELALKSNDSLSLAAAYREELVFIKSGMRIF